MYLSSDKLPRIALKYLKQSVRTIKLKAVRLQNADKIHILSEFCYFSDIASDGNLLSAFPILFFQCSIYVTENQRMSKCLVLCRLQLLLPTRKDLPVHVVLEQCTCLRKLMRKTFSKSQERSRYV